MHHFKAMNDFKLELPSGNAQFGSKSAISLSCGLSTLLLNRLKCILLETFKSTQHLNAKCLHGIVTTHMVPYDLRTTNLSQPKRQSTTYGLRSFSYLGARLWNNIVKDFPFLCEIDYNGFREFVGQWGGPDLDDGFNYV